MSNYYFNNKSNFGESHHVTNNNFGNAIPLNLNFSGGFNQSFNQGFNIGPGLINNINIGGQNPTMMSNSNPSFLNINNRNQYQYNSHNQGYKKNYHNKKHYNNNNHFQQQQQQGQIDEVSIVQSLKYVSEKYPQLVNLNTINIGMTSQVKSQSAPRFYVIKSFTEEDIHKVSRT
jgi:hypothetical protein